MLRPWEARCSTRGAAVRRCAGLALALARGCGDSEPTPEEQVRTTLTAFSRATAAKDYQALCDRLLAPSLIADLKKIGLPCEIALQQGLGDVKQPRLIVGKVTVKGKRATAEVRTSAAGPGAVARHHRARGDGGGLADLVADHARRRPARLPELDFPSSRLA